MQEFHMVCLAGLVYFTDLSIEIYIDGWWTDVIGRPHHAIAFAAGFIDAFFRLPVYFDLSYLVGEDTGTIGSYACCGY